MDKYTILKNKVLKISQKHKINSRKFADKSSNNGLFAAGMSKGQSKLSREISNELRNLILEVESIKENKTA